MTDATRIAELEQERKNRNVLLAALCGHDVQDPLIAILNPVELVRIKLESLESQLAEAEADCKRYNLELADKIQAGLTVVAINAKLQDRLATLEAAVRGLLSYTEQVELLAYDDSQQLIKHDAVLKAEHALGGERGGRTL